MALRIQVNEDGRRERLALDRPIITVGRALDNDLRLRDQQVSRYHCRLERTGAELHLIDHESANGTLLNGRAVRQRIPVGAGDRIRVGRTEILLIAEDDAEGHEGPERTLDERPDTESQALRALQRLTRVLNGQASEGRPDEVLASISEACLELTGAERAFCWHGEMVAARHAGGQPVEEAEMSRSLAQRVMDDGQPVFTLDAAGDDRLAGLDSLHDLDLRALLCVPLRVGGEIEGVLLADSRLESAPFSETDLDVLETLADQAGIAIRTARLHEELRQQVAAGERRVAMARSALAKSAPLRPIIGECRAMREVMSLLERFQVDDLPVLITGESGTGKELFAREIHQGSARAEGPFVAENCAALPETLIESTLFGHRKGAFTDAIADRKGLLALADGGTLLLDEVGELTLPAQAKLLRVVETGRFRPVGADRAVAVDVRLVATTHRDLERAVQDGDFRADLYFRLAVASLELAPLRSREGDVELIAAHFLAEIAQEREEAPRTLSAAALDVLRDYAWPGNVRELENEIRRSVLLGGAVIGPDDFSVSVRDGKDGPADRRPLPEQVRDLEEAAVRSALAACRGNKSHAAERLGITRFTLQRKLDKFDGEETP